MNEPSTPGPDPGSAPGSAMGSAAGSAPGDRYDEELRERLEAESGVIAWPDLIRHFARGVVVKVADELTLEAAALGVARDDVSQVQAWLESGQLSRASDDDARDWSERSPSFQCVVTAPWVLVREIE